MTIKSVLAGAALASVFAVAPAYAEDLVFTLNNQSSGAVNELYVGPPESNTWGEDILGQDVLDSGQTATITIYNADGKCAWDVRIVYDEPRSPTSATSISAPENGSYDRHRLIGFGGASLA